MAAATAQKLKNFTPSTPTTVNTAITTTTTMRTTITATTTIITTITSTTIRTAITTMKPNGYKLLTATTHDNHESHTHTQWSEKKSMANTDCCTDYYDLISEPMDLNKIRKRCSNCRYRSVEGFKRELALVASNCRLYCQDKFPTLPPTADAIVKVIRRLR